MRRILAGALVLFTSGGLMGCADHEQYRMSAPPPPGMDYRQPVVETAEHNGYSDGARDGQRDRYEGHSYRPTHSDRYEDAPGYFRELGGDREAYRSYYRDGYLRGYHSGYTRG